MHTGPGPMLLIDGGEVPYRFLRRIPEMVARRLEEGGVTEAVVGVPEEANLPWAWEIPRAVSLRLFPPPTLPACAVVPVGWLDHAMAWALDTLGGGDGLWGQVVGTRFPLEAGEAAAYFARAHAARTGTELWAGDPASRLRLVNGAFSYHQKLVLAGGGPEASDAELVEIMERLKDVARTLAPDVAQAFIDIHPTFDGAATEHIASSTVEPLCDEQAHDAFPWQVLGPGHLARLEGAPLGALPLGGGRVEVAVGDPADWLSEHLRPTVHEQGRELLAPLLLSYEQANDIYAARYRLGKYRDQDDQAPS